jgi:Holliday junction resolvasome RuvABC endonuclease subunit
LESNGVRHVGLEDYAYSRHSTITQLAENMGILKYFLHKHNISYDLYSPTSIKKCATGKGNAKKEQMRDAFYQDTDFDIQGVFGRKPTDKPVSPVNDIVDAYYLALSARIANGVQEREYQQKEKK